MALNGSGPISLAGSTAGQSIAVELGLSPTGAISLNDAAVRTLAGVPSGAIVMPTDFYGKSNRVTASATISSNTNNYTVNTAKAPGYSSGKTDFTLTINNGIIVSSTSTGSYAMTVDTSWAAGDTVTIVNNGTILGRGGNGGTGGQMSPFPNPNVGAGSAGGGGGPALNVNRAITMNNSSGRISGGGGGGGGGQSYVQYPEGTLNFSAGGGGGGGIGTGSGGPGGSGGGWGFSSGGNGSAGTGTAAGSGGSAGTGGELGPGGVGGNGGSYASSGSTGGSSPSGGQNAGPYSGGAGGAAIVGNSNITYTPGGTGTRNGSIS